MAAAPAVGWLLSGLRWAAPYVGRISPGATSLFNYTTKGFKRMGSTLNQMWTKGRINQINPQNVLYKNIRGKPILTNKTGKHKVVGGKKQYDPDIKVIDRKRSMAAQAKDNAADALAMQRTAVGTTGYYLASSAWSGLTNPYKMPIEPKKKDKDKDMNKDSNQTHGPLNTTGIGNDADSGGMVEAKPVPTKPQGVGLGRDTTIQVTQVDPINSTIVTPYFVGRDPANMAYRTLEQNVRRPQDSRQLAKKRSLLARV